MTKVIIINGTSRSGKTSFARSILNSFKHFTIHDPGNIYTINSSFIVIDDFDRLTSSEFLYLTSITSIKILIIIGDFLLLDLQVKSAISLLRSYDITNNIAKFINNVIIGDEVIYYHHYTDGSKVRYLHCSTYSGIHAICNDIIKKKLDRNKICVMIPSFRYMINDINKFRKLGIRIRSFYSMINSADLYDIGIIIPFNVSYITKKFISARWIYKLCSKVRQLLYLLHDNSYIRMPFIKKSIYEISKLPYVKFIGKMNTITTVTNISQSIRLNVHSLFITLTKDMMISNDAKYEVKISRIYRNTTVNGRIDCINKNVIIEFKATNELLVEHMLQLMIYAWIINSSQYSYQLINSITGKILQLDKINLSNALIEALLY